MLYCWNPEILGHRQLCTPPKPPKDSWHDLQLEKCKVGHQVVCVILDLLIEVFLKDAGVLRVVTSDAADQLVTEEQAGRPQQ